jgi:hypothetical protein
MTDRVWRGVWVSRRPLDCTEGQWGDALLSLELTELVFVEYDGPRSSVATARA